MWLLYHRNFYCAEDSNDITRSPYWYWSGLTGTPWAIRILGFMMVTSWCRRSGWNSNSSGVNFFITSSSRSAATEGTPYQVFGSPLGVRENQQQRGLSYILTWHSRYTTIWHLSSNYVDRHPVPVQVIDGVAPVILNMPAESWKHHSYIKPGDLHPRDVSINVAKEGLLQQRHHVQVPATAGIILSKKNRSVSVKMQIFREFFKQEMSDNNTPPLL